MKNNFTPTPKDLFNRLFIKKEFPSFKGIAAKAFLVCMLLLMFVCTGRARTITSQKTGNWDSTSTWQNGIVPTNSQTTDSVIIAAGDTVTVSSTDSITDVTINSSGILTINSSVILYSGGNLTVNGNGSGTGALTGLGEFYMEGFSKIISGTGTITVTTFYWGNEGPMAKTISSGSNLTFKNASASDAGLTNNGTVTFTGLLSGTGHWTQGTNAKLIITGATPTISNTTFTATGDTVEYSDSSNTIKGTAFYNLIINESGTATLSGATTVTNLTIAGGKLDPGTNNYGLTISGNLVNNGTLVSRSAKITFSGAAAQTISGTATSFNLDSLVINNSAGVSLSASSGDSIISAGLTLTSGVLSIGNNIYLYKGTTGTLSAGSATSYISFLGSTGGFCWQPAANPAAKTTVIFPTGIAGSIINGYRPVEYITSAAGGAVNFKVGFIEDAGGSTVDSVNLPGGTSNNRAGYIAMITPTTPSSGYGLSLSYNNSDFNFSSPLDSNVVFAYWNGSESIWARAVPDSTIGSSPYVIKADTVKWSAGPQNITLLDSLGINAWTGAVSTDWGTGGNWSTGAAPASVYSNVIIPSAPSNQPVLSAGSLTINSIIVNGTLTITGVTLTVSSTFTVNGTVTGTGALSLTGNGASIYGTGTVSTGHLLLSAAGSQSKTIMSGDTLLFSCDTVSITGASTITNNGVVTISGTLAGTVSGSAWINAANATLNIGGALLPTGSFTASATSNTVNYNGASQMVIKGTYYKLGIAQTGSSTAFLTDTTTATNLTVTSGTLRTGTKKLTCTTTAVSGTLLIDSAATTKALGTVSYPGSSGLIHIKAGATVTTASLTIGAGNSWKSDTAAAAVTISGDLTVSGSGSFTNSAATTYSISGNVSVDSSATFTADRQGKITLTGAAKTIGGTVTALYIPYLAITGSYTNTISTVGLTVDSTLSGAGTLTMATNAILKLGGTSSVASSLTNLNCTSNTPNTIIYYGSAPTLKGYTYYDLIVSPGGTATFSSYSTQTVNHNLYVTTSTLDGTSAYLTVMDSTILTGEFDVNSAMHIKAFGDLWIKNGGTLGIGVADTVVTMNNLTVDSGGYYWSAGTAAEITITGNVTINGIFTNIVASTYNISGNFANNATTFSAGTGTYTFNGTSSATVSGNDSTAFTNLVIDKDSAAVADTGRIVEFTNRYMGVSGTLTITSGTLKLSNSAHTKLSQSTYSIPSGGGLWLNSSNDSLVATSTGTGSSNSGLFRVTSGTYNNSISSTTQSFTTNSGALTEINGGAVNIGAGFNNSGTVKITGGTMTVGYGATSSSNALFASQSGSTLTMTGGTVAFQNANSNSAGDLFLSSGVSSITGGTLQIGATSTPASSTFHLNASNAGAIYNLTINSTNNPTFLLNTALTIDGSITNNSTGGMNANGNTVTLNGSATQNITGTKATSFYNLTVNNSAGVNLSGSVNSTVNDTLALTSGLLSTNSDTVILPSTAIITTTGGYVSGNLQRAFDATHKSQLFVIGDVNNHYTPVTVAFGSISTAGTFTARATAGNDPQVSSSGIDSLHSVNTYWQLTNNGIVFDTANATFNWPTGDVDAGSMTGDFVVGKYNSSSWLQPSLANSDSISVQAAALTSFGGIQIGQYCGSISLSSAAGTNAQTLCLNAALTPITYVVGGTITGSSVTGLPAGVTGSLSGGVYTISGTPTVSSGSPYSYTVTLGITGSCSAATASGTITVNPLPSAIISSSTNVEDCSGYGKNGAASVHASGGAGASPYTYSWSPSGGTDSTAGSLTAGIYMATVTDANGCSATTANDTIIQLSATCPDTLKLKFFIQGYYQGSGIMNPTLLYVAFDLGTDTADLLDKTDTVFVELHDPASVATAAQTYRGIVHTDGTLQCYFPDSVMNHAYYIVIKHRSALETWSAVPVTITDTAVSYDFTTDSTKAYGNNMTDEYGEGIWSFYTGDVTDSTGIESFASKDGVIDMYDYLDVQTDYQLFLFGYYSTDINGDGAVEGEDYGLEEENAYYGYAVMRPGSVTCTMTVTATTDSIIRCYGGTTSVTVSASSAYGDVFGATSHTGVAAGIHTYTLMDSYGCISSANDTVTQPTALTASISSSTNVSCYGGSTGAATVSVSGGTTSYTYSWTSGATTATASSLAAGTYTVTVTDAHSCTATATVAITQPSVALSASITNSTNISWADSINASAIVTPSGGTSGYTYSWSSGGTDSTAIGLTAGTYTVTVTDAHGCTTTAAIKMATDSISIGGGLLSFSTDSDRLSVGDTLHISNLSSGFPSGTAYIFQYGTVCGIDTSGGFPLHKAILCADTFYSASDAAQCIYNAPGYYTVKLTAITPSAATTHTLSKIIYVLWGGGITLAPCVELPQPCNLVFNGEFENMVYCPESPYYNGSWYDFLQGSWPTVDQELLGYYPGPSVSSNNDAGVSAVCEWEPLTMYYDDYPGWSGESPYPFFEYYVTNSCYPSWCGPSSGTSATLDWIRWYTTAGGDQPLNPNFVNSYIDNSAGTCIADRVSGDNAYLGVVCYDDWYAAPNSRVYPYEKLSAPMQAGVTYTITYYVATAGWSHYAMNGFGARFSQNLLYEPTVEQMVNNYPGFTTTAVIDDETTWTPITYDYPATGGEQYIYIGVFLLDADATIQDNSVNAYTGPCHTPVFGSGVDNLAYYYFDDVSVVPPFSATGTFTLDCPNPIIFTAYPTCGSGDYSYSWNYEDVVTTNPTTEAYVAVSSGEVEVTVKDNITGQIVDVVISSIPAGDGCRVAEKDTTIKSSLNGDIKLYPNPSNGNVTVIYHLNSGSGVLQLFDMLGKMVGEFALDGKKNEFEFDMGDLCCGIFEYKVMDSDALAGEGRLVIIR